MFKFIVIMQQSAHMDTVVRLLWTYKIILERKNHRNTMVQFLLHRGWFLSNKRVQGFYQAGMYCVRHCVGSGSNARLLQNGKILEVFKNSNVTRYVASSCCLPYLPWTIFVNIPCSSREWPKKTFDSYTHITDTLWQYFIVHTSMATLYQPVLWQWYFPCYNRAYEWYN